MQTSIRVAAKNLYGFYAGNDNPDAADKAFAERPVLLTMYETLAAITLQGVNCGCAFEDGYTDAFEDIIHAVDLRLDMGLANNTTGIEELTHLRQTLLDAQKLADEDTTVLDDVGIQIIPITPEMFFSLFGGFGSEQAQG